MKLSEFMRQSETTFFDITNIEAPLAPTLQYIIENIDVTELAQFCVDLQSLCNLWKLNEEDRIKSDRVSRLVSVLATCLMVDIVQSHAELVYQFMGAPAPIIPNPGELPSTSENT